MRTSLLILLSAGLVSTGCKSSSSGVKDAITDGIKKTIPGGLVRLAVDKNKVKDYIVAADGSNGAPALMNGIWWTNAATVHFVVSFKNVSWNPDTRTASIPFTGPGTYSSPYEADDDNDDPVAYHDIDTSYAGYDIVFNQAGDQAKLLTAKSDDNEVRQTKDLGYTMEFVSDGDWVRKTIGKPDYHLRRIIDADGKINATKYDMVVNGEKKRITPYEGFLADKGMGDKMAVFQNVQQLSANGGELTVTVAGQGGQSFVGFSESDKNTHGTLSVSDNFRGTLSLQPDGSDLITKQEGDRSIFGTIGQYALVLLKSSATAGNQTVKVAFAPLPTYTLDTTKPLALSVKPGDPPISVAITPPRQGAVLYRLSSNASFPLAFSIAHVDAYHTDAQVTVQADRNAGMIIKCNSSGNGLLSITAPAGSSGGDFQLTLTSLTLNVVDRGPFATQSSTLQGTLGSILDVHVYTAQDLGTDGNSTNFRVSPSLGPKNCCYNVLALSGDKPASDQVISTYLSTGGRSLYFLDAAKSETRFAVFYAGDYNASTPNLSYHLDVKAGKKAATK